MIYKEIISAAEGDTDWPGISVDDLFAWFNSKIELAPPEFRSEVMITIGSQVESYNDSSYATIDIGYYRPETEEEIAEKQRFEEIRKQNLYRIETLLLGERLKPEGRALSDNAMREWQERNSPKGDPK